MNYVTKNDDDGRQVKYIHIWYDHTDNSLIFNTDGATRLTINATGNLVSPATHSATTASAVNMRVESNGVFDCRFDNWATVWLCRRVWKKVEIL